MHDERYTVYQYMVERQAGWDEPNCGRREETLYPNTSVSQETRARMVLSVNRTNLGRLPCKLESHYDSSNLEV